MHKLKFILGFFLAAFLLPEIFNVHAQEKGLLWEVSGNDLDDPSYLFGTIHMICPDDYFWNDQFEVAFDNTTQLYLEIDMSDPQVMLKMQMAAQNTTGEKWTKHLTKEQIKAIAKVMSDKFGVDEEMFNGEVLDNFSLLTVYQLLALQSLSCEIPESYDMNVLTKAQKAKKKVFGLESIEDQLKIFEEMDTEKFLEGIIEQIDNPNKGSEQFDEMIVAYKDQDVQKLFDIISESPDIESMGSAVLDDRNVKWIPVIEKAMKDTPTFFAFGAGHLMGELGVINLLREQGYTVKPVK